MARYTNDRNRSRGRYDDRDDRRRGRDRRDDREVITPEDVEDMLADTLIDLERNQIKPACPALFDEFGDEIADRNYRNKHFDSIIKLTFKVVSAIVELEEAVPDEGYMADLLEGGMAYYFDKKGYLRDVEDPRDADDIEDLARDFDDQIHDLEHELRSNRGRGRGRSRGRDDRDDRGFRRREDRNHRDTGRGRNRRQEEPTTRGRGSVTRSRKAEYTSHDDYGFEYRVTDEPLGRTALIQLSKNAYQHAVTNGGMENDLASRPDWELNWRADYFLHNNFEPVGEAAELIAQRNGTANKVERTERQPAPVPAPTRDAKLNNWRGRNNMPKTSQQINREQEASKAVAKPSYEFVDEAATNVSYNPAVEDPTKLPQMLLEEYVALGVDVSDEAFIMSREVCPLVGETPVAFDPDIVRLEWTINPLGYRQQSARAIDMNIDDHMIPTFGTSKGVKARKGRKDVVEMIANPQRVTVPELHVRIDDQVTKYAELLKQWEEDNSALPEDLRAERPAEPGAIAVSNKAISLGEVIEGASVEAIVDEAQMRIAELSTKIEHNSPIEVEGLVSRGLYATTSPEEMGNILEAMKVFTPANESIEVKHPAYGLSIPDYYNALHRSIGVIPESLWIWINERMTAIVNDIMKNSMGAECYIEDFYGDAKDMLDGLRNISDDLYEAFMIYVRENRQRFQIIAPGKGRKAAWVCEYARITVVIMPVSQADIGAVIDGNDNPSKFAVNRDMYPKLNHALTTMVKRASSADDATITARFVMFNTGAMYALDKPQYSTRMVKHMDKTTYFLTRR